MHFCNDIRTQKNWQEDQFWIFTIKLTLCVSPTASYGAYPICKGCPVCSRDNGCVNCQPKLFLFLRRERMRQYGECLHDCPAGYYGIRSPELNICSSKSSPAFPNILPRHAYFCVTRWISMMHMQCIFRSIHIKVYLKSVMETLAAFRRHRTWHMGLHDKSTSSENAALCLDQGTFLQVNKEENITTVHDS